MRPIHLLLTLLSLVFTFSIPAPAQTEDTEEDTWPDAFSRHYTGTIGDKFKIEMHLEAGPARSFQQGDTEYRGEYWYENHRDPIGFWGHQEGFREIVLDEQVYAGREKGYEQTGTFKGKLNDDGSISGTWTDGSGKKSMPFKLKPSTPDGSVKVKAVALESSWTERTSEGVSSLEHTATVLQVSGVKAAEKINQVLLQDALAFFTDAGAGEEDAHAEGEKDGKKPTKKSLTLEDVSTAMTAERDVEMITELNKWSYNYLSAIQLNAKGILSTSHLNSEYTGGAHPNSATGFHTFDTSTGKELTLAALFTPAFLKALPELAKEKLRKAERLGKDADLGTDAGLSLGDVEYSDEALTWHLAWDGFVVHFNPYEVASYARGNVEFTIPWAELKPWLTEKSLLHRFLAE